MRPKQPGRGGSRAVDGGRRAAAAVEVVPVVAEQLLDVEFLEIGTGWSTRRHGIMRVQGIRVSGKSRRPG